jgi:hypothetical protein
VSVRRHQHGDRGQADAEYEWDRCQIRDAITCGLFGAWDETQNTPMGYDGGIYPPRVCASRKEAV